MSPCRIGRRTQAADRAAVDEGRGANPVLSCIWWPSYGTIGAMPKPPIPVPVIASPIIRRVAWHIRRVGGQLDRRFFISLTEGIVIIVAVAAVLITILEKPPTFESLFDSFNWGIATVLGAGDAEFV